jgi:cell division protein FtsB
MSNQNESSRQAFEAVQFRIRLERQLNSEYERGNEFLEEQIKLLKQRGELLEEQRLLREDLLQEDL